MYVPGPCRAPEDTMRSMCTCDNACLCAYLCVCVCVCVCVFLSFSLTFSLSLSFSQSVFLSFSASLFFFPFSLVFSFLFSLSVSLYLCVSVCLCLFVSLSLCLCVCASVHLCTHVWHYWSNSIHELDETSGSTPWTVIHTPCTCAYGSRLLRNSGRACCIHSAHWHCPKEHSRADGTVG